MKKNRFTEIIADYGKPVQLTGLLFGDSIEEVKQKYISYLSYMKLKEEDVKYRIEPFLNISGLFFIFGRKK